MTFRIWVALESLQYLDNHEPQRFDFCIECTPTDRSCQLHGQETRDYSASFPFFKLAAAITAN